MSCCDAWQAAVEVDFHFCMKSLIDPIPHCIQHVFWGDKDGKTWRQKERECLGVGQMRIKEKV